MYRDIPIGQACAPCSKGLGSIDLSTLSWEDYLIFGGIAAFLLMEMMPKPKRRRKKSSGGGWIWPIAAAGCVYLWYRGLPDTGGTP